MKKILTLILALCGLTLSGPAAPLQPLPRFAHISVERLMNVRFVQGAERGYRFASGDHALNSYVNVEVVGETLRVYINNADAFNVARRKFKKKEQREPRVVVEVAAPRLASVRLANVATFEAGALSVDHFAVQASDVSTCQIARLEATGNVTIKAHDVSNCRVTEALTCKRLEATIDDTSQLQVKQATAREDIDLNGDDTSQIQGAFTTPADLRLHLDDVCKASGTLNARNISLQLSDVSHADMTCRGQNVNLKVLDTSKAKLTVDCRKLTVENEEVSNVILRGTADQVNIDSSGVSRVDTSELNKF